jgi:hypothetical protein
MLKQPKVEIRVKRAMCLCMLPLSKGACDEMEITARHPSTLTLLCSAIVILDFKLAHFAGKAYPETSFPLMSLLTWGMGSSGAGYFGQDPVSTIVLLPSQ